jgi:plastocyanin
MATSERKRLIFTAMAIALVGIVTGLLLGGALTPSRAEGQLYAEEVTTTTTVTSVVHTHDDYPQQHTHIITTEVATTETTPHGYFHDLALTIGAGTSPTGSASTAKLAANEVIIPSRYYLPDPITVTAGTTVTWANVDVEEHSVTSNDNLFNHYLYTGEAFSYTFNEPGTFNYYCEPHSGMTGTVIVE